MTRTPRMAAALMALSLAITGCYGPFNLTRKVHQWNGQVGDKWANEIVFLVLAWLPVYSISTLADAIVFNSIEFWTGNNPVPPPTAQALPRTDTKRIARGDAEAVLTRHANTGGEQFTIEQYRQGQSVGSLHIEQRGEETVALDGDGKVLLTAHTLPDGSVLILNAQGERVAFYPTGTGKPTVQAASARHL